MKFGLVPKEECPRCHQRTISFWRKGFAGPSFPATCSACGARVHVSFAAGFGCGMIGVGGYSIASLYGWGLTSWLILAVGFAVALGLIRLSPLFEKKDDNFEPKVQR